MPFTLTMPKLTPTMEEGTIAKWEKKEGDRVEMGEAILEIATDKATVEHNAIDEGYLRKILVQEGDECVVGQPIAIFTEEKDESIEGYVPEGVTPTEAPKEEKAAPTAEAPPPPPKTAGGLAQPAIRPAPPVTDYHFPAPGPRERLVASPLARKLAEEHHVDLSAIEGTGPGGRIVARDVETAPSSGVVAFGSQARPTIPPGSYEEEKLSPMRRVVGQRLQEAKTFVPHFYVTQVIDAEPIVNLRAQLKEYGLRVSVNDLIVRATALALREKPTLNSGFNSADNTIIRFKTIDIAIAVSMPDGLITPVVRHADYKNVGQLGAEIRELAGRGRKGKLTAEEYTGGSITISNLGMYGVSDFIAVINPPQSSILAVGGILDVPVIKDGVVVPGKTMSLTISADHRVVDGADAADFLQTLKRYLENPSPLVI
jgi:pyruvate dehydrogenase E2 component (dihydrolipoyllysine-residue acetyltransferase)